MNENDPLSIANYLRIAKEDLDGAQALSGNRNAVYLLEQAAEKIIRAILTSEGKHAGRLHQLEMHVDQIANENPFRERCREVADLSRYATSYRYTTTEGNIPKSPSVNYTKDRIRKVGALLGDVADRFDVDLDKENTPARNPNPIR